MTDVALWVTPVSGVSLPKAAKAMTMVATRQGPLQGERVETYSPSKQDGVTIGRTQLCFPYSIFTHAGAAPISALTFYLPFYLPF